jgi:hypothetical protein
LQDSPKTIHRIVISIENMAKIKEEIEKLKLNCDIDKNADNSIQSHMKKGQNEVHKWCPICGHISRSDNHLKRHV